MRRKLAKNRLPDSTTAESTTWLDSMTAFPPVWLKLQPLIVMFDEFSMNSVAPVFGKLFRGMPTANAEGRDRVGMRRDVVKKKRAPRWIDQSPPDGTSYCSRNVARVSVNSMPKIYF